MKKIIFLILFFISLILSVFFNADRINVPYFHGLNKTVSADILFEHNKSDVFFNDKKVENNLKIDKNHYLFYLKQNKKIDKISFDNVSNIKKAMFFIDYKILFLQDFKNIKIDNNKTLFDKISVLFLSFFYNFKLYIFTYIFLFLYFYRFDIKVKDKIFLTSVLSIGLFLRLAQINNIPFWDDEIYSLNVTHKLAPLSLLFSDLGNPPLYFIYLKIFRFFVQNENLYRLSSVLIGILFNITFYIYLKYVLNKKIAKIGFFIVSINIVLIYFSQELRCYMLLMLFALLNSYFLFKFKNNKKSISCYLLSSILVLYTHFYGAFLVFYNFIFGSVRFYKNKKRLMPFVKINIVTLFLYLPLLIFKKMSLVSDFNSWLKIPDIVDYKLVFETFCGNVFIFTIFVIAFFFGLKFIQKKKIKTYLYYFLFMFITVFVSAIIVSYLVKPIFCYRYFYIIFPFYLATISIFIAQFKNDIKGLILKLMIFLLFVTTSRLNQQNLFCNHNLYLDFIKHDIDFSVNNYIFMSDTVMNYSQFENKFQQNKNTKIIYLPVNKGIKEIDFDDYNLKKPFCAYVLNLYLKEPVLKKASIIELYKTPLGVFSKTRVEK